MIAGIQSTRENQEQGGSGERKVVRKTFLKEVAPHMSNEA